VSMPTSLLSVPGSSGTRTLDFFPNGAVKSIADGPSSNASFGYDAFGALHQLTVHTLNADRREEQYFGRYIKQRSEGSQSVINRRIPVPGAVATLHGPMTGNWTFAFGEARGTRFVTDQTGAFVQGVSYQPFGEAATTGATPGTTNYENKQWNGGDLLAAFGVVNLGARVYDPTIGRFLSRDPILQASNP
jgi:RHS repeat-associated protein